MSQIERAKIFGKLNRVAYQSLESATVFCKLRGNPYVELAHWMHQLLQKEDSDVVRMIHYWGLDSPVMAKEVVAFLDRLPRGATSIQDFSPHLEEAVERAWIFASLLFDQNSVRSGHLLVALLRTEPLRGLLVSVSSQFASLPVDGLAEQWK
jgi:type VI secretion system protein VasG